jgi:hypothetical protein
VPGGPAAWSPKRLFADRNYDHDKYRRLPGKRNTKPFIARRDVAHGSGLGRIRWVVQRLSPGRTSSSDRACAGGTELTSTKT